MNTREIVTETVTFLCEPEDMGVIPEPIPAVSVLPDWYRRLPPIDQVQLNPANSAITIKRCMPFLDAMSAGWILPLAATVRIEVADQGKNISYGWDFHKSLISNHGTHQVAGNPFEPRPPCKFHNFWTIKTPPGWSCLFVPPLNRWNADFEILSGIVDTDTYHARVNFPFIAKGPDKLYILKKGWPMVQVIHFQRTTTYLTQEIRSELPEETGNRLRTDRNIHAEEGWYRNTVRAKR
jgi:Family of unknown function (DUF6065)